MEVPTPILKITTEQWHAQKTRGAALVVDGHPFIKAMNELTHEPIYQPVAILKCGIPRFDETVWQP
jgi:hypothetical protein